MRRRSILGTWLAGTAAFITVIAGSLIMTSAPASAGGTAMAAKPAFQMPFPCGQKWRLDTWAHTPAIDMVKEPDQVGTEGATLVASAAGTVVQSFYHSNAGNMVQIRHSGGWFTTHLHMQSRSVSTGQTVSAGQTIGKVGATGPTSNGHPHLHYEQAYSTGSTATWGYAGSQRSTITFNGTTYTGASETWRNVESHISCEDSSSLHGADFNSDGIGDIFSAATGTLNIWNGKGANNFSSRIEIGPNWEAYSAPIAGDFNGDGIGDLMAVKDGTLHVWNGKGSNNFTSAIALGPGWTQYAPTLMTLGDINNDGHTDIAAVASDHIHVWNGKGSNNFTSRIPLGPGWTQYFPN